MSFLFSSGLRSTIPDSGNLHARYDARELSLSDGAEVSTWPDLSGNGNDLTITTGSPTFRLASSSTINSVPTVDFDGSDDLLESVFASAINTPFSIFWLGKYNTTANFDDILGPESPPGSGWVSLTNDGAWRYGLNGSNGPTGGSVDTNAHIHSNILGTPDGSDWYIDETEIINNGAFSVSNLGGLAVGARGSEVGYANIEMTEILVYEGDKEASQDKVTAHLNRDTNLL